MAINRRNGNAGFVQAWQTKGVTLLCGCWLPQYTKARPDRFDHRATSQIMCVICPLCGANTSAHRKTLRKC